MNLHLPLSFYGSVYFVSEALFISEEMSGGLEPR